MAAPERAKVTPRKETSGLLMSVIRTLSISADLEEREREKGKLDRQFKDSDKKLDQYVSDQYEDLTAIITSFSNISDRISFSRQRIASVKESMNACKNLLHTKRDELRKLWIEGVEHRTVMKTLEQVENIRLVQDKLRAYMSRKHYLHATEALSNAVSVLNGELANVDGLRELKSELNVKKQKLHSAITDELHTQVYSNASQIVTVSSFERGGSFRKMPRDPSPGKMPSRSEIKKGHCRTGSRTYKDVTDLVPQKITEDLDLDPEDNPAYFIAVLIESLSLLDRLPEAIEEIRNRMQLELQVVVRKVTKKIIENAYQQGENVINSSQPKYLLELLNEIFTEFKCIAKTHQLVLKNLERVNQSASRQASHDIIPYRMDEVWAKIQATVQVLLADYLDLRNTLNPQQQAMSDYDENMLDINSFFAKKPKARPKRTNLFRFDSSSHALSMTSYLKEQGKDIYGVEDEGMSRRRLFVCKPCANNMTVIYNRLKKFIKDIEAENEQGGSTLQDFVSDFVRNIFLGQVNYNVLSNIATATKEWEGMGFDALKFLTEQRMQKELGVSRPLLQSTVSVHSHIQDLRDLTYEMPDYSDHFLQMVCRILQDYKDTCYKSYRDIVLSDQEDSRIISAAWGKDEDISRLLKTLPKWHYLMSVKYNEDQPAEMQISHSDLRAMNLKESDIFTGNLFATDTLIPQHEIISDANQLKTLGNLQESLDWFIRKMRTFIHSLMAAKPTSLTVETTRELFAPPVSDEVLRALESLTAEFQELSELCILVLHIEVRVHCFYYLMPVALQSNYCGAIDDMDPDSNVLKMNKDLAGIEEAMNLSLPPRKFRYIFEGLGHLVSTILINSTHHIKRINENGIKKMCRNIFAIQQNLTNITASRESDLDHTRQYYELLYLKPDEILQKVLERGPQFTELEYMNIFELVKRSKPGIDQKMIDNKLARLKEMLREVNV